MPKQSYDCRIIAILTSLIFKDMKKISLNGMNAKEIGMSQTFIEKHDLEGCVGGQRSSAEIEESIAASNSTQADSCYYRAIKHPV